MYRNKIGYLPAMRVSAVSILKLIKKESSWLKGTQNLRYIFLGINKFQTIMYFYLSESVTCNLVLALTSFFCFYRTEK